MKERRVNRPANFRKSQDGRVLRKMGKDEKQKEQVETERRAKGRAGLIDPIHLVINRGLY